MEPKSSLTNRCVVCGADHADRHHYKTRASGGPDDDWNIIHLCRRHHSEAHQVGSVYFWKTYHQVRMALAAKGWYLEVVGTGANMKSRLRNKEMDK